MRAPSRRALIALSGFIAVSVIPSVSVAGPWVDPTPGHGFVSISYARYSANEYFSGPGELDTNLKPVDPGTKRNITIPIKFGPLFTPQDSNYMAQDLLFYGEVSLYGGLGAVVSMPLMRYISQDLGDVMGTSAKLTSLNVGDLVIGLKYQVPHIKGTRGFDFGPQLFFTTPTGDKNGRGAFPDSLSQDPLPLPTGNGTVDMEARMSAGYNFDPIPMFLVAEVGYHHHFNRATCTDSKMNESSVAYSDDLPWTIQLGGTWAPHKKWFDHGTLIANLHGVRSFQNGDVPGENVPSRGSPYTQTCGQANNMSYLSMGGTLLLFPVKWVGVTFSVEHSLIGVNTGYGLTLMPGIAAQF